MQRLDEVLALQRLLQTQLDPLSWMQLIYLAAMFMVLIWRKEAIVNAKLFRASYLFFGASLIVGPIVLPMMQWIVPGGVSRTAINPGVSISTHIFINALGPACFAGAVVCGMGSMAPQRQRFSQPVAPTPHPLD